MSLDFGELVLTGQEVTLKPLTHDYAEGLAAAAAERPEAYRYNNVPQGLDGVHRSIEHALASRAAGWRYPFVIIWNGRVVGTTSYSDYEPWKWPAGSPLQRTGRPDVLEIGYTWLAVSAQRTRCNTEAKYLLLQHAFEAWEVHRVTLRTDERNQQSRRAIERLGAQFEGIRRCDKPGADGTVRNSAFYSIVQSEWPDVKAGLIAALSAGT